MSRFWKCFHQFSRSRLWTALVFVVCMAFASILAGGQIGDTWKAWPFQTIHAMLGKNSLLLVLAWLSTPILGAYMWLRSIAAEKCRAMEDEATIGYDGLLHLMNAINSIVGKKQNRFVDCALKLEQGEGWPSHKTFKTITKPEEQYEYIVEGLFLLFRNLFQDERVRFQVVLARMDDKYLEKIEAWAPSEHCPFVQPGELRHKDAGFSRALKSKDLIVVTSISAEADKEQQERRYRPVSGDEACGSMLCYPVKYREGRIPFVLSVKASQEGLFQASDAEKDKWKMVFKFFEIRIVLEYALELLRNKSVDPEV